MKAPATLRSRATLAVLDPSQKPLLHPCHCRAPPHAVLADLTGSGSGSGSTETEECAMSSSSGSSDSADSQLHAPRPPATHRVQADVTAPQPDTFDPPPKPDRGAQTRERPGATRREQKT